MRQETKGTFLTLVAGTAWGISGVSGQYLIGRGMSVEMITSLRLLISGIVLLVIAKWRIPKDFARMINDKKSLAGIIVFGLLGLVLNQLAYLKAVGYTNAGTATVLQYLCPVLVLAYTCLRARQRPTLVEVFSILLAIGGTFLIATHGQLSDLAVTPVGLFWGIFSAFTYAIYIILPVNLIREYGSLLVMGFGMLAGGILLSLRFQIWKESLVLDGGNLLGLFGIVSVGTIFAYTVFLEGVSLVGSVKGSLLATIEPIASVLFSVLLVHEIFYPIDMLGMAMILGAVLLISVRDMVALDKDLLKKQL